MVEDSRQNMFWSHNKDEIIYPAAALGVVMNVNSLKQRFMGTGVNKQANGHTDNVLTLGVDPSRKRVVTGSIGARPSIIVWDADTMEILSRTNLDRNTRAVSALRFSRDGNLFFCSDKHNDSNVYCFETSTGQLLGKNKCGADPVFDGQTGDNNTFAVATKRTVWFFEGPSMDKKKGIFNGNEMTAMITITYDYDEKLFYSGTANGCVYVWQGNSCIKTHKLHEGSVMGLAYASGKLLSSGSKDNSVKISKNGETLKEFKIEGYAKSLDLFNGNLLIGSKFGEILTINE